MGAKENGMRLGICSFSFHRLLAEGKQDMFRYITDCKELGCTQLDPWNAHLADLKQGDGVLHVGRNPGTGKLSAADDEYVERVKHAAQKAGLPFGCIAVDGAHIYEEDEAKRNANRAIAYRWLDIAAKLGAKQVRIDAGGPEDMPPPVFVIIRDGYRDLIDRAASAHIEVLFENHWGPSKHPDNVLRLLEGIEGLGFLFDTNNWAEGKRDDGWNRCAKYAKAMHVKTFRFDEHGNEPSVDIPRAIRLLLDSGYTGAWGVESVPREIDEYEGARKTIALIRRCVGQ
jgi:sugar phosphate isomerase/epimerase